MAATTPYMVTKICSRCREPKNLSEFGRSSRSKDGLRPECKQCRSDETRAKYATLSTQVKKERSAATTKRKNELQSEVIEYMVVEGCADCPERDPTVLEFDHVRGIKLANVSELIIAQNRKHLWIEIAKCDVVCANCHRKRTAERGGWFKNGSDNAVYGP